jgi:hypothetical protein
MRKIILLLAYFVSCCNIVSAAELVIRHVRPENVNDQRHQYYIAMLRLALEKTQDSEGPFRLVMKKEKMSQTRAMKQLKENKGIDIVWTMTSMEREKELKPIRIPLLKGLLGHRIFIIRQEDECRFTNIQTFKELKQFRAGQGKDWPDMKILRANGISVEGCIKYEGLFRMLKYKRFDYFPRGVNEPWKEVETHQDKNLMVEKTLLLQYPAPIYFFVFKENAKVAQRLEKGLRLAIKDGSFDQLFRNHPSNKQIFDLANIESRKIFKLKNPLLPPQTPLLEKALWYGAEN